MIRYVPRSAALAATLAALLAASCGKPEPDGVAQRIRLVEWAAGRQHPNLAEQPEQPCLTEDFATGWDGWHVSTNAADPLRREVGILNVELGGEEGAAHLTLRGTRGALFRVVPVEPSSAYAFRASVRSRDLDVEAPFFGATTWLAELTRSGTPEEVLAEGPSRHVSRRHLFESSSQTPGWQPRERIFITGADTRALLVALNLSFEQPVKQGAVDFRDLSLTRVPLSRHWELERRAAVADYQVGEEPLENWRSQQLVRGHLGGEVRPSILVFPGEATSFTVPIPGGAPVLELGIGRWAAALRPDASNELSLAVKINDTLVWESAPGSETDESPVQDGPEWTGWKDIAIDLSAWAGSEQVELELSARGTTPGLFGAPVIRDTASRQPGTNVILISIDTLRADYVGSYGAPDDPTPHLDAFAEEGVRFAHVDGQAPYTLPGHATMFSGQFPSVHGVQRPSQALSSRRSPVLARILSEQGYRTQAFTGGGLMSADFGFDKGFDGFANIDTLRERDCVFFRAMLEDNPGARQRLRRGGRGPESITRELIDSYGPERLHTWLADHRSETFFLFIHTYSVHDYDPPEEYLTCRSEGCTSTRTNYEDVRLTRRLGWNPQPISKADTEHLRHLYTATIRYVDVLVGALLEQVDALGLRDNTIVAITTDHGEEILERGFRQHGKTLYEELTQLPMIIRGPGISPRVYEDPAMLVDLTPTLLGALGIPLDPRMQGVDLLASSVAQRNTWSEIHDDFVNKYALRTGDGWKVIHAPEDHSVEFPAENEWELYRLTDDPGERHDLGGSEPERLALMQALLRQKMQELEERGDALGSTGRSAIDEETLFQLEQLGYVEDGD